jgi:hypothetical protein
VFPFVGWPPHCVLRSLTGVPCPFCGMTTGTLALLHGDVAGAFAANPGAPLFAIAVVVTLLLRVLGRPVWMAAWRGLGARLFPLRWPVLSGMWVFELHRFAVR